MSKNIKITLGLLIIAVFLGWGFYSLLDNKLEYVDFKEAQKRGKKVEVQGVQVKEKGSSIGNPFIFYMKDKNGDEMKVVYAGMKPNNFDEAESVVVKGKMSNEGSFHADDILTKCPSKYEGKGEEFKNSVKQQ